MTLEGIKSQVIALLKESPALSGVTIAPGFCGQAAQVPYAIPHLFVSLQGVDIQPSGFGSYLGSTAVPALETMKNSGDSHEEPTFLPQTIHGMSGLVTLRFDCYLPQDKDIALWDSLLEHLCQQLLRSPLGITRFWSHPPTPQEGLAATHVVANATLQSLLTTASHSSPITGFELYYREEEPYGLS